MSRKQDASEDQPQTRADYARQQHEQDRSERSDLLKKRLDLAIGIVLLLLVLVLFILFKL
ncbi:MAG: hypothetical protein LKG31_00310 [Lactobacillus sp.]|jgi:lipopolysaccharide/colanic/teichoic acid biosynthesis glycosyltransferase|nr:hypothetical protein [Lactobacillus sp.]